MNSELDGVSWCKLVLDLCLKWCICHKGITVSEQLQIPKHEFSQLFDRSDNCAVYWRHNLIGVSDILMAKQILSTFWNSRRRFAGQKWPGNKTCASASNQSLHSVFKGLWLEKSQNVTSGWELLRASMMLKYYPKKSPDWAKKWKFC